MMVLRRRIGEAIRINDDIRVVIEDVRHEFVVRIGIDAPADVAVHRLEVFELIERENRAASAASVMDWLRQGGYHDSRDSRESG
ncbi:MAG: carbon storage regulator [Mariprofundales bacterium]|nr:carbon storage regulator [Mariprofundales bacterium]